jgi:hypothetical protein
MKLQAADAARQFVEEYYPHCQAAILAGSAGAGTMRDHSDLDLVILDNHEETPYRRTFHLYGWPIEMFLLNEQSYPALFRASRLQGTGALLRMCAFGTLLKDGGSGSALRQAALRAWHEGPLRWSLDDMNNARYTITEELIDLEDSVPGDEAILVTFKLIQSVMEFCLRVDNQWSGDGKWLYRTLQEHDPHTAQALIRAVQYYFKQDDHQPMISFIDQLLEPYGGRLQEGFQQYGLSIPSN